MTTVEMDFSRARALAWAALSTSWQGAPEALTLSTWGMEDAASVYLVEGTVAWLELGQAPDMDPQGVLVDKTSGRVTTHPVMELLERLERMEPVGDWPAAEEPARRGRVELLP